MGKYALENYEKYPTTIIRPRLLKTMEETQRRSLITIVEVAWRTIEATRGVYNLSLLEEMLRSYEHAVLILNLDTPNWLDIDAQDYAATFIRRVGSYIDGTKVLHGVVIKMMNNSSKEIWSAYADSFTKTTLYCDLFHPELIHYFQNNSGNIGLYVSASEDEFISCCEQFARLKLNEFWMKGPVLLDVQDDHLGPLLHNESRRWHVSYSNKVDALGYHFELRRVTYPTKIGAGGHLPLRFWFVNIGTSKPYRLFQLKIMLRKGQSSYSINLNAETEKWLVGDIIHNEIVEIPKLESGKYGLSAGLFYSDGSFISLNIDCTEQQGYYELGEIELDEWSENLFEDIWNDYYPEGYYPLEDPALPTQD